MPRFFVILLAVFVVLPAHADPASDRLVLGRQLVELMGYNENYERTGHICIRPEGSGWDPRVLVEANPNALGGITPKSSYWPRLEAVYKSYRLNVCRVISAENMLEFLAGNFSNRLSTQELRAAINFYSSLEGRSLRHVVKGSTEETMARFETATNVNSSAHKEFWAGLQSIINEYQKNPK